MARPQASKGEGRARARDGIDVGGATAAFDQFFDDGEADTAVFCMVARPEGLEYLEDSLLRPSMASDA
ncbi:MAG: hypothetical protein WDZ49_02145 [Litorilinea sp.]